MPAYPGVQSRLTQVDGNSSVTGALDNAEAAQQSQAAPDSQNKVDLQQSSMPSTKPLPSKKSWKNRPSTSRQADEEINRVARQILAFIGTNL